MNDTVSLFSFSMLPNSKCGRLQTRAEGMRGSGEILTHVSMCQAWLPCDELSPFERNSSIDVVALHNCFDGLLIHFLFSAARFWGGG